MLRNFEQQLPPTFQLSKTQNLSLSFYLKLKGLANYNITLKSYRNKMSQLGLVMKSDLNLLQSMTTLSTSRHVLGLRIVLTSLVRVDVVDVADTSSRHEHLPEIKFRLWKASEFTILIFEITFFLKTDKLKSAFKLRLTSSGRKLWPILVLLYFQVK